MYYWDKPRTAGADKGANAKAPVFLALEAGIYQEDSRASAKCNNLSAVSESSSVLELRSRAVCLTIVQYTFCSVGSQ